MLARRLFRDFVAVFLIVLIALCGMSWLMQALRLVEPLIGNGASLGRFFALSLLTLPGVFTSIAPFALFIAIISQLYRMLQDNTFFAMAAAGISPWYLLRPIGALVALITLALMILSFYITPLASRQLRYTSDDLRAQFVVSALQPGVFRDMTDNVTGFVKRRAPDGGWEQIIIFDNRAPRAPITYIAASGYIRQSAGDTAFVLRDGQIQRGAQNAIGNISFGEYVLPLAKKTKIERRLSSISARNFLIHELLAPARYGINVPRREQGLRDFAANKIAKLANPLILALIAFTAIAGAGAPRNGYGRRIFAAILLALAYQAMSIWVAGQAAQSTLWLLALLPLAAALALLCYITLRVEPHIGRG